MNLVSNHAHVIQLQQTTSVYFENALLTVSVLFCMVF